MKEESLKSSLELWLKSVFQDPIAKILYKNSHLTKIQLETILIDVLAEKINDKVINYDQKAKLRLMGDGVTRGSFNRSLAQARTNIIKSIYTIILLGYLGILETPNLDPYIEIATKIRIHTEAYRNLPKRKKTYNENITLINALRKDIENTLDRLKHQKSLKNS